MVGVDGSPASDAALAWAVEEAVRERLELTLVHGAGADGDGWGGLGPLDLRRIVDDRLVDGQAALDAARSRVRAEAPTVRVRMVLRLAGPRHALMDLAGDAAMLVLGAHELGAQESPLTSMVSYLATHAPCAVVVRRAPGGGPCSGIVAVVDDVGGRESLTRAYDLAARLHEPLTVVLCPSAGPAVTGALAFAELVGELTARHRGVLSTVVVHEGPASRCLDHVPHAEVAVVDARLAPPLAGELVGLGPNLGGHRLALVVPSFPVARTDRDVTPGRAHLIAVRAQAARIRPGACEEILSMAG